MYSSLRVVAIVGLVAGFCLPASAETLTQEQANALAAKIYSAFNQPATKDVKAILSEVVTPDFKSHPNNDSFKTLEEVAAGVGGLGQVVPDLKWEIKDVIVAEDHIVVRGEASGTPAVPFLGVTQTGKSFKIMSIDVWTITDGKASAVYHLEDWSTAVAQLSAK
jgi:predicted ester cyclase